QACRGSGRRADRQARTVRDTRVRGPDRAGRGGRRRGHRPPQLSDHTGRRRAGTRARVRPGRTALGGGSARALVAEASQRRPEIANRERRRAARLLLARPDRSLEIKRKMHGCRSRGCSRARMWREETGRMKARTSAVTPPRTVGRGRHYPLGATWDGEGVNFALYSRYGDKVELCLFDPNGRRQIESLELRERTDFVWHSYLPDARP